MSQDRMVYSTEKGSLKKAKPESSAYQPSEGPTKMRLETKGRGGKAVTVLWNFPFTEDEVRQLMKKLQAAFACGASFKEGRVEFQGDLREKLKVFFDKQGWKLKGS